MSFTLPKKAKVALHGVSRNALVLGRACALNDSPVLGVFDPDREKALRAALFLGVSAQPDENRLLAGRPDLLLCPLPLALPFSGFVLNLFESSGETAPGVCWAVAEQPDQPEMPEEITSDLPALSFRLSGDPEAVTEGLGFLRGLSDRIQAVPA